MKNPFIIVIGLLFFCSAAFICPAQNIAKQAAQTKIPVATPYTIATQDANSRVWQRSTYDVDPSGNIVTNLHSYTELASGLNHQVNGQWVASSEQINILPNGTAVAINGQHQAYFPGDIYNGQIKLVTPDGLTLNSRPLALAYSDGTNTATIAVLTNSTGIVVGNNQVVYPNAFTQFKVDLRYTYTKAGFEQDIILKQQPPTPESLGLNPDTARLQVLTEFFSPPQPTINTTTLPVQAGMALTDQRLGFGAMQMIPGKAFLMGQNAAEAGALVDKHWITASGRQFLVEEVPVDAILTSLASLPLTALNTTSSQHSYIASKELKLSPQRLAENISKTMLLAKADLPKEGFVLDYQTITGSLTNYTFRGDTTYYVSGGLFSYGTNTFEGGAVIKYATNAVMNITPGPPGLTPTINWQGSAYRPVIFTAVDDNSVGDTISGSTGTPTGYYGSPMLNLAGLSPVPTLTGLRMSYAQKALTFSGANANIYNAQFVNCWFGISSSGGTVNLRNVLFGGVGTNFTSVGGTTINAQNTTFSGSGRLWTSPNSNTGCYVTLTNCLLINVAGLTNGVVTFSASYNGFYNAPSFGSATVTNYYSPFQSVGAGYYYLITSCFFQNAGTTNIDPVLLADLKQTTTYPPILYSNVTVGVNTNLSPQAQRDTDVPDLGYHYDPIDYLVDKLIITNVTMTVSNGVTIACYNESGIQLQGGSAIFSTGTPLAPNWFTRYQSVQEQPILLGGTNLNTGQTVSSVGGASALFQFSKFACPAFGGFHINDAATTTFTNLIVKNCEFWGGQNYFSGTNNSTATLVNNLFYRSSITATATNLTSILALTNNLIFGTTVYLSQPTNSAWTAFNNDFDSCTITNSTLTNGYNAYLNYSGRLNPTNINDVVSTNTLAYQTGPFGTFYLTSSPLVNAGSTTADQVGLYHFTTQINQTKETNSIVDIGYHYVAIGTNGLPLDSNVDGVPDYLEDANGNGLVDNGEAPWNFPSTNFVLWLKADAIIGLTNNAPVATWYDSSGKGYNATQGTIGSQPLYVTNSLNGLPVMRFNGTSSYFNLPIFLSGTTSEEAFLVLQAATNRPANPQYIWQGGNSGGYGPLQYPNTNGHIMDGTASTGEYDLGVPSQPLTNYNVYEVSGTNGGWAAWLDGQLLGSSAANTYGYWSANANAGLGWDSYNQNNYFGGNIAEVLVFNRTLTGSERVTVNNYLNLKYGLVTAVPATPTNLVAQAIATNQISLTWNETFTWGGTQINVQRSTVSNGTYQVVAQLGEALAYVDTNLAAGTTYYYQVAAVNAAGSSAGSNLAWATTTNGAVSLPLGNLVLWLKADSGLAQSGTNTPVSFWADQSGSGNHATQGSQGNQPVWVAGALNGLPVMRFNGTSSYFNLPIFLSGTTSEEAFLVLQAATNRPANPQYIWQGGNSGGYGPLQYPNTNGHIMDGTASTGEYDLGVPSQPLTNYNVYEVSGTNGGWAAWLDGQLLGSSSANTYGYWSYNAGLGWDSYNQNNYFGGNIAEVLVFNRTLTGAERVTVNNYLNLKYGLVTAVPATPTNLVAQAIATNQISLTWNETFNWGGTQIYVQRSTASNGTFQVVAQLGEALAYVDTNLASGTTYYYQVTAVNAVGSSAGSNLAWATTTTNGAASLPLANLVLWLKADSGLTQAGTNTPVSFWADQSGNANHGTQPAPGNQPVWVAGALNGLPVMRFNGVSSYFKLPVYLAGTTAEEAFLVLQAATNRPATPQYLWQGGQSGGFGPLQYPNTSGHITDGTASTGSSYDLGMPSQPLTNYNVYEVSGTNGSWAAWLDGQLLGSSSANTYGYWSYNAGLGWDSYNQNNYFGGNIAEVLVFNRTLTGDEKVAVGAYLVTKYSLARYVINTSLPSAPTNLVTAGVSPTSLNLQWVLKSTNATAVGIQRKLGTNGTYLEIGSSSVITNFVDVTADPVSQYFYRISAKNYFGQSGYSTVVSPPVPNVSLLLTNNYVVPGFTNLLKVQAADAYGSINQVKLYSGLYLNTVIGTGTSAPYTNKWVASFSTTYVFVALATDTLGNSRYSAPFYLTSYKDSNGDGIPDFVQVSQGNNPLNPWTPPAVSTNDHTAPIITLLIPTNAVIVP